MWILFLVFPSFVLIGSAVIAILCDERRPIVLLCLGGMVGMVATSLALSLLGLLFGLALATWLVFALLVAGGLAAIVYWWRSRMWQAGPPVSWKYVVLLLVLAIHFGVVAAVSWQFAIGAGVGLDNLMIYSAFPASIARGNFPVVNPYQPDTLLSYRLSYHVLGGFVARLANRPAPEAHIGLNAALFAFLFLGAVGMGLASRFGPWQTVVAAVLCLTIGMSHWLQQAQLISLENAAFNHHTMVTLFLRSSIGIALTKGLKNASLSYGHLVVFCGLTLYIYAWRSVGWRRTALPLATGVVLGHLAAASETWFVALAAALFADMAIRFAMSRKVSYESMLRMAGAAIAMIITAVLGPGVLFARLFGGTAHDLGVQFKGAHIVSAIVAMLQTNEFRIAAEAWEPLIRQDFARLWGLMPLAALALVYAWHSRHRLSWLLLLYSGACFCAYYLFTVDHAFNMARFFHSGSLTLAFAAGLAAIWLLSCLRSAPAIARATALFAFLCGGVLYTGGFLLFSLAVPWLSDPRPPLPYRQDVAAVKEFLIKETEVRERLLVLGNSAHWDYSNFPGSQLARATLGAYVAAYSGQYSPTGALYAERVGPAVDTPQLRRANAAQGNLSAVDLQELDITYLYASSPWLTGIQRAALAEKLARGSLDRVWHNAEAGPPQACRAFLRLEETARENVTAVTFADGERVAMPRAPLELAIPLLRAVTADGENTSTRRDKVQATVLMTVSQPATVIVESGAGFSMRVEAKDALSLRTPPLDVESVLKITTDSGAAHVLWLELYAPMAPLAAAYLPEHLDLCGETAAGAQTSTSI